MLQMMVQMVLQIPLVVGLPIPTVSVKVVVIVAVIEAAAVNVPVYLRRSVTPGVCTSRPGASAHGKCLRSTPPSENTLTPRKHSKWGRTGEGNEIERKRYWEEAERES